MAKSLRLMIVRRIYFDDCKPWMVLKQTDNGSYCPNGRKYNIRGLNNFVENSRSSEIVFESEKSEGLCKAELAVYEKSQERKKTAWRRTSSITLESLVPQQAH